jgi:hypothetical protein
MEDSFLAMAAYLSVSPFYGLPAWKQLQANRFQLEKQARKAMLKIFNDFFV